MRSLVSSAPTFPNLGVEAVSSVLLMRSGGMSTIVLSVESVSNSSHLPLMDISILAVVTTVRVVLTIKFLNMFSNLQDRISKMDLLLLLLLMVRYVFMESLIVVLVLMMMVLHTVGRVEVVGDRGLGFYLEVTELRAELRLQGPHVLVDLLLLPFLARLGQLPVQDPEVQTLLSGEEYGDVVVTQLVLLLLVSPVVLLVLSVQQGGDGPGRDTAGAGPATAEDQVSRLLSDVLVEAEYSQGDQGTVDISQPHQHSLRIVGALLDLRHLPDPGVVEGEVGGGGQVSGAQHRSQAGDVGGRLLLIVRC